MDASATASKPKRKLSLARIVIWGFKRMRANVELASARSEEARS